MPHPDVVRDLQNRADWEVDRLHDPDRTLEADDLLSSLSALRNLVVVLADEVLSLREDAHTHRTR